MLARSRTTKPGQEGAGPVVYWMSRDQRAADNWALLAAQQLAIERARPLVVLFALAPTYPQAARRHYHFLLAGLRETAATLAAHGIPLVVLPGDPPAVTARWLTDHDACLVVHDFDPLRHKRVWVKAVAASVTTPMLEVDAHNIVPCWLASPKLEYGAYTLRPKLQRLLPQFLTSFPPLLRHPHPAAGQAAPPDWDRLASTLTCPASPGPVPDKAPGASAGAAQLHAFVAGRLSAYHESHNDPLKKVQSGLSPHLHFGQLSAQRAALAVLAAAPGGPATEAFLEELIIRRELSDNFCYYQPQYDTINCAPNWARDSLERHRSDPRPALYAPAQLEAAQTDDPLWNAAQTELTHGGAMPGYLRMYWAKRLLEWTDGPEEAQRLALAFNDRYALDGRDPNGYAGVAWSLLGVHDRAWFDRPIFGKIRYMNANGARKKFDVQRYIQETMLAFSSTPPTLFPGPGPAK